MFTRPVFYIPLVPSAAYFEGQETTSSSLRELLSFRRNQSNLYLLHLHLSVHQLSSQAPLIFCRIYAGIFHAVTAIQLSFFIFSLACLKPEYSINQSGVVHKGLSWFIFAKKASVCDLFLIYAKVSYRFGQ